MSREGDLIRKALKRSLLPELQRLGFTGRASAFQRVDGQRLDLLDIQYWKYGGGFILEFASCARGPLHTSWGEVVPEEKLQVAHINPVYRARLQPGPEAPRGPAHGWFGFAGFGEDLGRYDRLAGGIVALLPQVDEWLRTGTPGSHVHPLGGTPGQKE